MGIIGVARWKNAPPDALGLLRENIIRGHGGRNIGLWRVHLHSYRSGTFPSRSIFAASTNDHAYAVIEDASADSSSNSPHPRISFVTLTPPEALGAMLAMVAGNWTVSRTNAALQNTRAGITMSNVSQLALEGFVYAIGTDWVIRVGIVRHGQTPKGLVIEAEYLPLKEAPGSLSNAPIVSEFLSSIAPKSEGETQILSVKLDEEMWATVVKSQEDDEPSTDRIDTAKVIEPDEDDDIFCTTEKLPPPTESGSRERRSAFLILRCLQGEGLL